MCQKAKTDRGGQKNDSLSVNMAEYLKKSNHGRMGRVSLCHFGWHDEIKKIGLKKSDGMVMSSL